WQGALYWTLEYGRVANSSSPLSSQSTRSRTLYLSTKSLQSYGPSCRARGSSGSTDFRNGRLSILSAQQRPTHRKISPGCSTERGTTLVCASAYGHRC